MEKVTAYKCSYCKDSSRSIYLSQSGCAKHEKRCWLNPERKSCATCGNLIETNSEDLRVMVTWGCSRMNQFTPFKQKVSNCLVWTPAAGIFADEDTTFRRPVERRERGR